MKKFVAALGLTLGLALAAAPAQADGVDPNRNCDPNSPGYNCGFEPSHCDPNDPTQCTVGADATGPNAVNPNLSSAHRAAVRHHGHRHRH